MKPKRQFSCKKNFHIKTNDVFNVDSIPQKTLNQIKRGKKQVDNVRSSNFNGISLNFDYNKYGNEVHLGELPSDGHLRRFSNLRNKENHLTNIYSPVSINQLTRPIPPQEYLKKPVEVSGKRSWEAKPIRNDTIQFIRDNQIVKLNSIDTHVLENKIKNRTYNICPAERISYATKNNEKGVNYSKKESHSPSNQKERIDQILKTENQALNQSKQQQYDYHSQFEAQVQSNLPIEKSSRNFIATSMRKDYNNLTLAYNQDLNNQVNNITNQPKNDYMNFRTQISPSQSKPRLYSADPSSETNVSIKYYSSKHIESFEKNSLRRNQKLLEKLERQDLIFNNFRNKLLDEENKKKISIERLIDSQRKLEEDKQRRIDIELYQMKNESKKLHTKILQLQIMDKSKRRAEQYGK